MNQLLNCTVEMTGTNFDQSQLKVEEYLSSRLEGLWRSCPYGSRFSFHLTWDHRLVTVRLSVTSIGKSFYVEYYDMDWKNAIEGALERLRWKIILWKRNRFETEINVNGVPEIA